MMKHQLEIFNTLTRKKEIFEPLQAPNVGMYVCGPTVYGDPHLGHARPAITFDLLYRYLMHIGYKVRYVRNITDVGHLENDADDGEDKIAQKARLDNVEPMEVAQHYTNRYHTFINQLNVKEPSIEPRASGHIIEQQEVINKIIEKGYAYESNGSVYFDVVKYNKDHNYGVLSGRVLEEQYSATRELDGQSEKKDSSDFALWKKASPTHIMRWPSKYSDGFPGWHIECTAMSAKYLGEKFDIHGGGMDLLFPHHESEIAQGTVAFGDSPAKYWMHNNMITINGQKMGKSLGNFITLEELFTGSHKLLEQPFSPMTIRFFILQAHYRSTLDFSNDALKAAERGLHRLLESIKMIEKISPSKTDDFNIEEWENKCYDALNDDLNSPILIAHLFEAVKNINSALAGTTQLTVESITKLSQLMKLFTEDILGLKDSSSDSSNTDVLDGVMELILDIRQSAKENKDWTISDKIRDQLNELGIQVKDGKDGATWEIK